MTSLRLFCKANAGDCFESILARSWYMNYDPRSYAGLAERFGWWSLILSDNNRVCAAVLHAEYIHHLSHIVDDDAALKALQEQYYTLKCTFTPIYRLPVEILTKILHTALDTGELRMEFMHVCQNWRRTIEGMSNIWTYFKLQAWTASERVQQSLTRAGALPLTVDIDIDMVGSIYEGLYSGLARAAKYSSQWETLIITSLPQTEQGARYIAELLLMNLQSLDQIKHLKVMPSVSSPIPHPLLQNVATSINGLASMEIYSSSGILNLLQPIYTPIFGSLTTFKAQVPKMSHPIDLLPHFNQLEVLELINLLLPIYNNSFIPLVSTLHVLHLQGVSIQWMGSKVFSQLESCTIMTPPSRSHPLIMDISLPVCTTFRISNKDMALLRRFHMPIVGSLLVKSNQWSAVRGNEQALHLSHVIFGTPLQLYALHLAITCPENVLIVLLELLPCLQELKLNLPRPSSLGKHFFIALLNCQAIWPG